MCIENFDLKIVFQESLSENSKKLVKKFFKLIFRKD